MDRLEAMAVFVAVAELRGFAPAARRLRLSPSAVTRLVAALEEHLDARLLQRTTRSVTLTDAGARYLERARRILGDVEDAEDDARSERSVPKGRFVLTAPTVFGRVHVSPILADFLDRYPEVRGELRLFDRMASFVEEGIDAAVRIGVLEDSSSVARPIGSVRRVLVASPCYLEGRKKLDRPEDLARHDLIQFTGLTPGPTWRFVRGERGISVQVTPRYVTNGAEDAVLQAERGRGVALVLAYQVHEAVRAGRLSVLLPAFEPPPSPIQLVFPTARLLSAKVRAFAELVTKARWSRWDV